MIGVQLFDVLLRLQHTELDRPHMLVVAADDLPDAQQLVTASGMADRVTVHPSGMLPPGQVRLLTGEAD